VTDKRGSAKRAVAFHEGRGARENIFAELESHCRPDYVPVRTLTGNRTYLLAGALAHNLAREPQTRAHPRLRAMTAKRTPLWAFDKLGTLQRKLIQRAGRLTARGQMGAGDERQRHRRRRNCCIISIRWLPRKHGIYATLGYTSNPIQ
jgi:hypothetical protein